MMNSMQGRFRLPVGWTGGALMMLLAAMVIGCGGGGGGSTTVGTTDATTDSTTDATTDATTDGTTGTPGVLPNNVIFYQQSPDADTIEVRYITPAGAGDSLYAKLKPNYAGLALNPVSTTQRYFGFRTTSESPYGIFVNNKIDITGANPVVTANYDYIVSMQMSPDGKTLYYIAQTAGAGSPQLFKLAVNPIGTPVALDAAENFHLNAAGDRIVYSKLTGDELTAELYTRGVNAGDSATRLTTNAFEDEWPQWNKAGNKIVFSSTRTGSFHIFTMNADGTGATQVTGTAETDDLTPTFNEAGNMVAYLSLGGSETSPTAIYRVNTTAVDAGKTLVKAASDLFPGTYWTGTSGRSGTVRAVIAERIRRHKDLLKR